jgi:hypothetical protein
MTRSIAEAPQKVTTISRRFFCRDLVNLIHSTKNVQVYCLQEYCGGSVVVKGNIAWRLSLIPEGGSHTRYAPVCNAALIIATNVEVSLYIRPTRQRSPRTTASAHPRARMYRETSTFVAIIKAALHTGAYLVWLPPSGINESLHAIFPFTTTDPPQYSWRQ